jgi:hypothetical protein
MEKTNSKDLNKTQEVNFLLAKDKTQKEKIYLIAAYRNREENKINFLTEIKKYLSRKVKVF